MSSGSASGAGYDFEFVYTGELWRNADGGLKTGSRYLDNVDATLQIDLAQAWGLRGTLFAHALYNNGTTLSDELVGDAQTITNIDTIESLRVFELWYEFGEGPWSLRSGLYAVDGEFDINNAGGLFINSSHGTGTDLGQSGENGPSIFPVSALGVRYQYRAEKFAARIAVLDGVPGDPEDPASNRIDLGGDDGLLMLAELELPLGESGRFWGGYWRYSEDFERIAGGFASGNDGLYAGLEFSVPVAGRSIDGFVRYGRADDRFNDFESYLGAGLVVNGPFPSRAADQIGIAIAIASAGGPYRDALELSGDGAESRETNIELTYRTQINPWLALQPNLQFVKNPASTGSIDNALVIGLRFEASFATSF